MRLNGQPVGGPYHLDQGEGIDNLGLSGRVVPGRICCKPSTGVPADQLRPDLAMV